MKIPLEEVDAGSAFWEQVEKFGPTCKRFPMVLQGMQAGVCRRPQSRERRAVPFLIKEQVIA